MRTRALARWVATYALLALFVNSTAQAQTSDDSSKGRHLIAISGPEELVLSHTDMTCGPNGGIGDRTDMAVSAFRRKDGSVVVLAGNQRNYFLEGSSVDTARRTSCANLVPEINDPDPSKFLARRWLVALHAVNYDTVLGFVHNEYHGGEFFPDRCIKTSQHNFECWYASVTLVRSRDGGFSFEVPAPPGNVLAAPPFKFEVGKKRVDASTPKVVGNPNDGFVYVMISYRDLNRDIRTYQCLLRGSGNKLDDWRAWDGHDFTIDMRSPYLVARGPDCAAVLPYNIHSVRYVPALKQFVALGVRGRRVVYTFSHDLIAWSRPQTLTEVTRKQTRRSGDPLARDYFSLLDPSSSSINFDTLEGRPYLYFVQYTEDRRRRDLYRVPLAIK
jgi:hypothetical protein